MEKLGANDRTPGRCHCSQARHHSLVTHSLRQYRKSVITRFRIWGIFWGFAAVSLSQWRTSATVLRKYRADAIFRISWESLATSVISMERCFHLTSPTATAGTLTFARCEKIASQLACPSQTRSTAANERRSSLKFYSRITTCKGFYSMTPRSRVYIFSKGTITIYTSK